MNFTQKTLGLIAALSLLTAGTSTAAYAQELNVHTDKDNIPNDLINKKATYETQETDSQKSLKGYLSVKQGVITPTNQIRDYFRPAAIALCNSTDDFIVTNPLQWKIKVTGEVEHEITLSLDEIANDELIKKVMSCTCGGNPTDGAATITAMIKGIPINYLLTRSGVTDCAQSIKFISTDGKSVTLPIAFVIGRHAILSYEINGEDLSASVGGNNQLWMNKAPAKYFLRDISEIQLVNDKSEVDMSGYSPNTGIQQVVVK